MPEHLDVQNIPVSKRRDLTVDLCGKFLLNRCLIVTSDI